MNRFSKRKEPPPYWRLTSVLKRLRLKYIEREIGEKNFHIVVETFGILFTFSNLQTPQGYTGWSKIDVDLEKLELNAPSFSENLMWLLISKGYMLYLRNKESGDSQLYKHFLIDQHWAFKIIDKRLELYNNRPEHKYLIEYNKRVRSLPIHFILMHYPGFFDYLY